MLEKIERIILFISIVVFFLLIIICVIMWWGHSTHEKFGKKFDDQLIIGHTAIQIQEVYGEFDLHYYYSDEGYYNWYDPEDPNNQGVVLRRGKYLVAPSERAPDYRKYPVYYVINFNEQGVATEAYLWEMMDGG